MAIDTMAFARHDTAALDRCPPPLADDHALFLDFDGTLVALAAAPDQIHVPDGLPDLLTSVAVRLGGALAIVSGRPVAALGDFLQSFSGVLIGQHGLERREADGRIERQAPQPGLVPIRRSLEEFAARHPGLLVEDKGASVALHYRQVPLLAPDCRRRAREAVIATCGRFRALVGHEVVELLPKTAGKGHAVAACLAQEPFRGRVPVFIGDDTGDEPAFETVNLQRGLSIRVGAGG